MKLSKMKGQFFSLNLSFKAYMANNIFYIYFILGQALDKAANMAE